MIFPYSGELSGHGLGGEPVHGEMVWDKGQAHAALPYQGSFDWPGGHASAANQSYRLCLSNGRVCDLLITDPGPRPVRFRTKI